MQAVQADVADVDVVGLHAAALHLLHDDLGAVLSLFVGIRPCKAQHGNGLPALVVTHAELERVGAGLALDTADADTVVTHLGDGSMADIHVDIRGQVVGGIMDLVQELLLAALFADDAAAVGSLGDLKGIIGQLCDGEAQLVHAGDIAPVVHIVAAGTLTAALQQMACHDAAGQIVPIVSSPAKLVLQRSQEQGAVSRTAGDDHIGTLCQASLNALMADVDIAVIDLVQNIVEIAVVVEVGEGPAILQQLRDLILDVIAGHITDLITAHAVAFCPLADAVHAAIDVHAACVGADLDVLVPGFLAGLLQDAGGEVGRKALGGVLELLLCHDGKGQLCQIITAHILDIGIADHVDGRVRAVAPEALATADCNFLHSIASL